MLPNAEPGTGFCAIVTVPQLSASSTMPVNTFGTTSLQLASTIGAGQVNVGAMLSTTVTVATQIDALPAASVTVRVTLLSPTLAQVNVPLLIASVKPVQLSEEPPSTSAGTMLALPEAFRLIVMSSHTAVGVWSSSTVTVKLHTAMLPPASVAVYCTFVAPSGNTEPLAKPSVRTTVTPGQSSVAVGIEYVTTAEHSSTSVFATMLAGQVITGSVSSVIVTVTLQVVVLPLASVAVTVIVV